MSDKGGLIKLDDTIIKIVDIACDKSASKIVDDEKRLGVNKIGML